MDKKKRYRSATTQWHEDLHAQCEFGISAIHGLAHEVRVLTAVIAVAAAGGSPEVEADADSLLSRAESLVKARLHHALKQYQARKEQQ